MKKLLLLGAAIAASFSAFAADDKLPEATPFTGEDVTPPMYRFNGDSEWKGFTYPNSTMAWNMPVFWMRDNFVNGDLAFGDGCVVAVGPNMFVAEENSTDVNNYKVHSVNFEKYNAAANVIDFGGTLGKCLVINGKASTLQDRMEELGVEVEIPKYEGSNNSAALLFWNSNPPVIEGMVKQEKANFRIRMTLNAFYGGDINGEFEYNEEFDTEVAVVEPAGACIPNIYANNDQNTVNGGTVNISNTINFDEFVYNYTEMTPEDPGLEPFEDDNEDYVWNPYRFMVYEFDATDVVMDDVEGINAFRLKMQVGPKVIWQDAALLIRSVEFFVNNGEDDLYVEGGDKGQVKKTYTYYTIGGESQGVAAVEAAPVRDGRIYNLQGIEVTNANVPGIYIRDGKKFIVK